MINFSDLTNWQTERAAFSPTLKVGFVPTMGNLHPGHLSLCKQSQMENDLTIVSIFVNPTQFNQQTDYLLYPKTLEADLKMLEEIGVDYCVLPTAEQLYPDDYQYRIEEHAFSKLYSQQLGFRLGANERGEGVYDQYMTDDERVCNNSENSSAQSMEGQFRPGHFTGVLTVVMKLFQLIKPHHAYFGEKDFQQYELIKKMVQAFFMDIQVQVGPTIREKSGLAYSSRNNRLSPAEKQLADTFAKIFRQPHKTLTDIQTELEQAQIQVEYLQTLNERRFVAVHIGQVRLIDNYNVEESAYA
jgi:pantoate--beta-alanine ligase